MNETKYYVVKYLAGPFATPEEADKYAETDEESCQVVKAQAFEVVTEFSEQLESYCGDDVDSLADKIGCMANFGEIVSAKLELTRKARLKNKNKAYLDGAFNKTDE